MGKWRGKLVGAIAALAIFVCPIVVTANADDAAQQPATADSSTSIPSLTSQPTDNGLKSQKNLALDKQDNPIGAKSEGATAGKTAKKNTQNAAGDSAKAEIAPSSPSTVAAQSVGSSCGDSGYWGDSSSQARWSSMQNGSNCVVTVYPGVVKGSADAPWSVENPLHNQVTAIDFANGTGAVRLQDNIVGMFSSLSSLGKIQIDNPANFDVSGTDGDFSQLFKDSTKLQSLNLTAWKSTAHPKKMGMMFMGDTSLTDLDLSGWDTSAVTDMSSMFRGDVALRKVDVSGWDVRFATDMSGMFLGDAMLTTIDGLEGWTQVGASSSGLSLREMFSGAKALSGLNLSAWAIRHVTDMAGMFADASALADLNLSGWDTSQVKDMSNLFARDINLKQIDGLADWDTGCVELMPSMFSMVRQVPDLPLPGNPAYSQQVGPSDLSSISGWDVRKVRAFSGMFMGLNQLVSLDLSQWHTDSAVSMQSMFAGCSSLGVVRGLDGTNWQTGHANDLSYMFYLDGALTSLGDLSHWNTDKVQNMEGMFRYDESLADVRGMKDWNTARVTSMAGMFQRNRARADLKDVAGWKTGNVALMWDMFGGDSNLTSLDLSGWDTSKVTSMTYMFQGTGITSLDLSGWNTHSVRIGTNARACADGTVKADAGTCRVLPEYLNELTVGPKTKLTPEFFSGEPMKDKGYTGRWVRDDNSWASNDSSGANEQLAARCPGSGSVGQRPETYLWQQTAQISFDANLPISGAKLSGGSLPSAIRVTGAKVSKSPQTVPESALATKGYRFTGWNTVWNGGNDLSGNPGKAYQAGDKLTLNRGEVITLYAQWQFTGESDEPPSQPVDNEKYTVRYVANEPEGLKASGVTEDDVFAANAAASTAYKRALAKNGYRLEGYAFQGWSRVPSSTTAWDPGVKLNMQPGINTMYAQWKKSEPDTSATPSGSSDNGAVSGNGQTSSNAGNSGNGGNSGSGQASGSAAASGNGQTPGSAAASGNGVASGSAAASGNGVASGNAAASGNGTASSSGQGLSNSATSGNAAASGSGQAPGNVAASGNGVAAGNGEAADTDSSSNDTKGQGITVIMQPATLAAVPRLGAAPTPVTRNTTAAPTVRAPSANGGSNNGQQQNRDSTADTPHKTVPRCVERSTGEVRNSASGVSYVTSASTLPYCDNGSGETPKQSANSASAKTTTISAWWWLLVLCLTADALGAVALRQHFASLEVAASRHRKGDR